MNSCGWDWCTLSHSVAAIGRFHYQQLAKFRSHFNMLQLLVGNLWKPGSLYRSLCGSLRGRGSQHHSSNSSKSSNNSATSCLQSGAAASCCRWGKAAVSRP